MPVGGGAVDQGSRSGAGLDGNLRWWVESILGDQVGGGMPDTTCGGRKERVDAPPDTVVVRIRSTCFLKSRLQYPHRYHTRHSIILFYRDSYNTKNNSNSKLSQLI